MAGVKLIEKKPENISFLVNRLLDPEIRAALFDDYIGFAELTFLLHDPFTFIYFVFEKGHPVPIGCVLLVDLRPYRGCSLHAAIFDRENRGKGKLKSIAHQVRGDLVNRWRLRYVEATALAKNEAANKLLSELGFNKLCTKPGYVVSNGKYEDLNLYYMELGGPAPLLSTNDYKEEV